MSAAYPYLHSLRKGDLTDLAESSKLTNYSTLKKAELEEALDDHLAKNQTKYGSEPALSEYYKRLAPKSPVKKIVEKVTEMVKSEDEAPVKKARRKTVATTSEGESASSALIKTPGKELARRTSAIIPNNFPPSPAVVADAFDRQQIRVRNSIAEFYEKTNISEYIDQTRDLLSSPTAISVIALLIEAYGLRQSILPWKSVYDVPAVKGVKDSKTTIYGPDVFLLFNSSFLAPFTLWLLTSLILPLLLSYTVNIPLKTHPAHNYKTRKATAIKAAPSMQFDPLVFNVAKALVAYVVYAKGYGLFGLYPSRTLAIVDTAIVGGYTGTITSSAVGGLLSLYEAVLKK